MGALSIAYREAGDPANPKIVLLHGFPSSSHQYRNLVWSLADRFHVIAPDYPGFGNSDLPDPKEFAYTFDNLADVIGHFLEQKGFTRFGMYVQDYGGPVGFRIVTQKPEVFSALSFTFPVPGSEGGAKLGLPDLLFFALFLGAAARWQLRTGWTWICLTASIGGTMALATWWNVDGLPALPLLALGFLLPNADLLWRAVRDRGATGHPRSQR